MKDSVRITNLVSRFVAVLIMAVLAIFPEYVSGNITIKNMPIMDKLPEKGVWKIFRDSEGYMWYGTGNGLCRDDGFRVNVFHPGNANSVNDIAEDSLGHIVLATDKGALLLDKKNYKISQLEDDHIGGRMVQSVYVTDDGDVWLTQKGELHRYDKEYNWKKTYPIFDRRRADTYVSGFCQARDGQIYMTSYSRGVYRYDPASDNFVMAYPIDLDVPLGAIIQDRRRDYFWMRDFRGGLYRFSPSSAITFVRSLCRPSDSDPDYSENLLDMVQDDREGYLWGVSRNHLLIFRPDPQGHLHPVDLPQFNRFSGTMMSSLLCHDGTMWIGRIDSESSIVNLNDDRVSTYPLHNVRRRYDMPPMITAVVPDSRDGMYWMLQHRSGLLLYNTNNDRITYNDEVPELQRLRLRMGEVISESKVHKGVWVSQEKSLAVFAITHDDMKMSLRDSVIIDHLVGQSVKITRVFEDSRGRVWVGTTDGLFSYDLSSREFSGMYPDLGFITGVAESKDKKIYVLSKGLGLFEINGNHISEKLPDEQNFKRGTSLDVSPEGTIWIGTDQGGVLRYDPETQELLSYSSAESENNSGVKQLFFTSDGHGWIVSDTRLIEFNPKTKQHYIYQSGTDIPLFRFLSMNSSSSTSFDKGGVMGGAGGLVVIDSNPLLDNPESQAKTVISDIIIGGKSVLFDLEGAGYDGEVLKIEPDDMNIEVFFSSLDYRNPSKLRFAYRIKGFDTDWQYTRLGDNRAFYNSLPKGKYVLEAKLIDEYNRESMAIVTLKIEKKPHLYETWWAYMVYVLVILAIVGAVTYYYIRRAKAKNEEMWTDSQEMIKMRSYLSSPVTLPDEEFQKLDRVLLEKATKEVESRLDDPDLDVNSLAGAVNMSRSTFSRKLKSITGKTPLDFIREIKMQHACKLLESKNYTIGQISDMLGFSDRRYFTACFRKEMGMSPRDYQNSKTGDKRLFKNKCESQSPIS